jgi:SAM-dependent methyltransferase
MNRSIASMAADPLQYDSDELFWEKEGSKDNFNRRLYLECLEPFLSTVKGESVLDLGCGHGWLCEEVANHGGVPLGLDPSIKNITVAHDTYPSLEFIQASLQDFKQNKRFDSIMAVMVLEHFLDLEKTFKQVAGLLKPNGQFVTIIGDFDKFTNSQSGHPTTKENLDSGEVAIRVDYGDRIGIMCDIMRTVERVERSAIQAGLTLHKHDPILPPSWHPRYETYKDKPIFHLLTFTVS